MSKSRRPAITNVDGKRNPFAFAVAGIAASVIVFPALLIETPAEADTALFWVRCIVGLAGWFLLYLTVWSFLARQRGLAQTTLILTFAVILFLRFLHYGVTKFSGTGFSSEFFLHLEPESFRVAWAQFPDLIILGVIAIVVLTTVVAWLAKEIPPLPMRMRFVAVIAAPLMLWSAGTSLPEWQFLQAWWRWNHPEHFLALAPRRLAIWQDSGLVETRIMAKETIKVAAPEKPLNLILVYLESFGLRLIDNPKWPGLTPNLSALLRDYALVDFVHASSYFTLMGTVNSQCGTLFPFEQYENNGNNVLAASARLGEHFPCLGDALRQADYQQTYMVGANEQFAGFSSFLRTHGYDHIKGLNYWSTTKVYNGAHRGTGTDPSSWDDPWGLTDAELLEQANNEIQTLRRTHRPFNITIQTSGTHIPGYRYKECQSYGSTQNRFLDAIHCTDQLIGRWVERLVSDGQLKDTILILTADHNLWANREMRSLFGDTVHDHRLPLIVIGPRPMIHLPRIGALYDLAPTTLDLLQIRHNVRFPLGRSLFSEAGNRDYFFSLDRNYAFGDDVHVFFDAFKEKYIRQEIRTDCNAKPPEGPLHSPLTPCERWELSALLSNQLESLSTPRERLNCQSDVPVEVVVPTIPEEPLVIRVEGRDEADRFVAQGMPVQRDAKGLFALRFTRDGDLVERFFAPAATASTGLWRVPEGAPGDRWLIIWRADPESIPPKWLNTERGQSGMWWAATHEQLKQLTPQHGSHGLLWELTPETCRNYFS
jgi:hypothetical protein